MLRKYVSVLVVIALVVLAVGVLRNPLPRDRGIVERLLVGRRRRGGADDLLGTAGRRLLTALRGRRGAAFAGGFFGYGVTQIACLLLGVVALSQVQQNPDQVFDLFLAVPLGTAAFAVLVLRETDQSFANVYSTAVSIQNMAPRWDRRILTVAIGTLAVAAALTIDISQYTNFLYLIGAVFIPLSGALIARLAAHPGSGWNTSSDAPVRPGMLVAWAAGFVAYQLVNPGRDPRLVRRLDRAREPGCTPSITPGCRPR